EVLRGPGAGACGAAAAEELAEQPGAPVGGGPDVPHGDLGRAALEGEGEQRLLLSAPGDLDPAVGVGWLVVDDLDLGLAALPVAVVLDAVAVSLALALGGGSGGNGSASGEPLGHAGGVRDEGEDPIHRHRDGAREGEGDGTHGANIRRSRAVEGGGGR